ncbi:MAG: DUF695 domain-containing protein [Bacteroidetes bacterium]|nr:DUF695 domain-containing protein [Bacteroidota bacterium]
MLFLVLLSGFYTTAQEHSGDWDTYIMTVENKPVSVMVDLAFGSSAEAKAKPNAIIIRIKLLAVLQDGMPTDKETKVLNEVEDSLVTKLQGSLQATYAGRYTAAGVRDFYFYSNDTSGYKDIIAESLKKYPAFRWLAKTEVDTQKDNYFNVLYPTSEEMELIKNRRMVDQLRSKGDIITAPRRIDHFIFFKTEADRKAFALAVQDSGFVVENAGREQGIKDRPYSLQISRADKTDYDNINKVTLYLWKLALQHFAKYDGWETFVVRGADKE